MATPEALRRWRSVLFDIEQYNDLPSGQRARAMLNTPQAKANWRVVNTTLVYRVPHRTLTVPFSDLWSQDYPTDPALLAVLQPVWDRAISFTPFEELLPQWDSFVGVVRNARQALDTAPMGEPTAQEVIAEMMLSLKTTLLIAGTGHLGSMTVIARELARRHLSFKNVIALPLRHYDLATNAMVDLPSETTLSLAAIKAIVDPGRDPTDVNTPPPSIMKQFAAQAVIDLYTNWEEYYRPELARVYGCSKYNFQIDYFGDLGKMRHDYVHNRGICSNSARCRTLNWFSKGDLMIPTPANYLQLLTEFPADELGSEPEPVESGRDQVKGSARIPVLREFDKLARELHGNLGPALDEALSAWVAINRPAG
jgi:hypothetical protein